MEPITLIGSYPPPYGGVSVHIKRLRAYLAAQGVEVTVLADPGSGSDGPWVVPTRLGPAWYLRRAIEERRGLFHLHASGIDSARLRAMSLLARCGRTVILTLHSLRDAAPGRGAGPAPRSLAGFAQIVCVGPAIRERLLSLGAPEARLRVIPPYLPPERTDAARRAMEPEIDRFIASRTPVLTASAYRLVFHDGLDLYGLDLCIELCLRLLPEHPRLGFVFALPEVGDAAYFAAMQQRIGGAGLGDHCRFARAAAEYWPIIERSSVLVRPTSSDSYGISVMEAIDLGVPAVASDVCLRPPGAILFRSRDPDDLVAASRRALGAGRPRSAPAGPPSAGSGGAILALYREVLAETGRRANRPGKSAAACENVER
jgi:glycosyltransferase involved in cell wall biosynthesis